MRWWSGRRRRFAKRWLQRRCFGGSQGQSWGQLPPVATENTVPLRFAVFERTFKDYGLPRAIRTDNGVPFASAHALYGLGKLAVWWLRLGVGLERIRPGHPEQNGRHERMHLTLKQQATKPVVANLLQQQARFDAFVQQYNDERPHQALAMRVPADLYMPSHRAYARPGRARLPAARLGQPVTTADASASGTGR